MKDATDERLYNEDENQIRLVHYRVKQQFPVSTVCVSKFVQNQRIFSDQLVNNFLPKSYKYTSHKMRGLHTAYV